MEIVVVINFRWYEKELFREQAGRGIDVRLHYNGHRVESVLSVRQLYRVRSNRVSRSDGLLIGLGAHEREAVSTRAVTVMHTDVPGATVPTAGSTLSHGGSGGAPSAAVTRVKSALTSPTFSRYSSPVAATPHFT
eukprot:1187052-Prorocentrum_minimum.AAC.4